MINEPRFPLTKAQLELLSLFNREVAEQDWIEVKRLIQNYFGQKAIREADQLWEEQGWNQQVVDDLLNTRLRTPYRRNFGESA